MLNAASHNRATIPIGDRVVHATHDDGIAGQIEEAALFALGVCEIADAPDEAGDHDRRDDEDDKRRRVLRIFNLQGKQRLDEKVVQQCDRHDGQHDR